MTTVNIKDGIKYGRGGDSEVIRAYNGCLQYHHKLVAIILLQFLDLVHFMVKCCL